MKKLVFILCLILIVVSCFARASEFTQNEEQFVQQISQTVESLKHQKNLVWNEYNLSKTPLVITFSNGHIYAYGLKSKNPVWQVKKAANANVLFSSVDQWGVTKVSMQDKFLMDGEEVFVFQINENDTSAFPEKPLLILVHELFHRYQFDKFRGGSGIGEYVDQLNIESLILIGLEERILVDFLRVKEEYKLDVLKNYLAVHKARCRMMNPSSLEWERFQQVMEGLADYASIQTFKTFPIIQGFDEKKYLSHVISGYIYSTDHKELAVKWRHYGVGATLGMALDFLKVNDWKNQIEMQGQSQGSILEKTISLSEKEINQRLSFVKKHYDYEVISKEIKENVANFNAMIAGLIKEYESQSGIVVTIERPLDVAIYGGGRNYGIFHLENDMKVSVKDSSYSSSTDNSWKIELKEIPFLFQDEWGARILKVDRDLVIKLDGKAYTAASLMASKKPIPFKTLSWDGKTSNFEVQNREGDLIFDRDGLRISLKH